MKIAAVIALTLCQFTVLPFVAMVAANTARIEEAKAMYSTERNTTTIFRQS